MTIGFKTMRGRTMGAAAIGVSLIFLGAGAIAEDKKEPPQTPPGFDYWQPDWMVRELWGPGRMPKGMMARLLRHTTYMQYGVAEDYEGATSTVAQSPETIAMGREIFANNCASCHGSNGLGNGENANALSPSPALLAYMIRRPISVDEYLLWSISDGGEQFGTEMPAFKDTLSREEIWRVVAFMRAGFPADDDAATAKPSAE